MCVADVPVTLNSKLAPITVLHANAYSNTLCGSTYKQGDPRSEQPVSRHSREGVWNTDWVGGYVFLGTVQDVLTCSHGRLCGGGGWRQKLELKLMYCTDSDRWQSNKLTFISARDAVRAASRTAADACVSTRLADGGCCRGAACRHGRHKGQVHTLSMHSSEGNASLPGDGVCLYRTVGAHTAPTQLR